MNDNALSLRNKIIEVISRPEYQPNIPDANGRPTTWCNEAANAVLVERGFDTRPILEPRGIGWTGATAMYDNCVAVSKSGGAGVFELSPRQAQLYADQGWAVLAAARRTINDDQHASHVGIVCPTDDPWNPAAGPWIGQAGAVNGFRSAYDSFTKWGLSTPRYFIMPLKA
jgi:hypothetical protein